MQTQVGSSTAASRQLLDVYFCTLDNPLLLPKLHIAYPGPCCGGWNSQSARHSSERLAHIAALLESLVSRSISAPITT